MADDDLFEDDGAVATEARPGWGAPEGHEARPPGGQWGESVKHRWALMSGRQKAGAVAAGVAGLFLVWGYFGSRGADEAAPEPEAPPSTMAPALVATTTTEPPARLVERASDRLRDDPLRALPDLHPMVVAYAGNEPQVFGNVITTLVAGGADICHLFFGVDEMGWRVVPPTADATYPNDYFPVRAFLGHPCPVPVGNPDPVIVPTATSTPA